jgi:sugar lactone lactonase YvrE
MTRLALSLWVVFSLTYTAGTALAEDLLYPRGVAVDGKGFIYVADAESRSVLKLDDKGGPPRVLARGEAKYRTPLYRLTGIAVSPNGDIAVSDTGSSNVYRIINDKPVPVANSDSSKSPFAQPQALAFDASGDLIVPDLGMSAVFRVSGDSVKKIASVHAPTGSMVDKAGNIIVVSSTGRLARIDTEGKVTTIAQGSPFEFPLAVAPHPDGGYVVADSYAGALFKVSPDGKVTVMARGEPMKSPNSVAAEPGGRFVVADPGAKAIFRVDSEGRLTVICRVK